MQRRPLRLLAESKANAATNEFLHKLKGMKSPRSFSTRASSAVLPPNVQSLVFKFRVERKQPGVAVKGFYQHDNQAVSIDIQVSSDFSSRDMRELRAEVTEKVQHEFKHSTQPVKKLKKTPAAADPSDLQSMLSYYTNPEEASAHVAGFKAHAKSRGVPVSTVVDEKIEKLRHFARKKGSSPGAIEVVLRKIRRDWNRRLR